MSFILDALKKSETDRQQQSTAEFASVPSSARPAAVPRWLWVVGLLLLINLAVLIGLLLRPDAEPRPIAASPQRVETPPGSDTGNAASFTAKVAEARMNPPGEQAAALPTPPGESTEATTAANDTGGRIQPVLISQDPGAIPARDLYPSIHEVRATLLRDLPELHLDIHVYNPDPADRFVFINMAKLREGSQLAEGPVVAEITPDGVVLGHQGQLFLLPRD